MARPSSKHPTELELEVLKVLWQRGPLPGREVREALAGFRKLAYTSVLTVMNIMTAKGYLSRAKEGQTYVYEASVTREATTGRMLDDLVDRAFDGSAAAVMVNLLETGDVDAAEIERLRRLIDRKTKEQSR